MREKVRSLDLGGSEIPVPIRKDSQLRASTVSERCLSNTVSPRQGHPIGGPPQSGPLPGDVTLVWGLYRSMGVRKDSLPDTDLSTLFQDPRLFRHGPKSANDLLIAIHETIDCVWDLHFFAELSDQLLCLSEVVSRDTWPQVMDGLKLQAAVHKVKPRWAIHVHCCAEHSLWKALVDAKICRAHGKVAQSDLDVKWSGDHVADHDEDEPVPRRGDREV